MRCDATTAAGDPCRGAAKRGAERCAAHLGLVGRHTDLTPEVSERIIAAIRAGAYANVAATHAGIAEGTYYEWLQRGRDGREPFAEFEQAVARASADAEVHAVAQVRSAMGEDWRAAIAYLERRHPGRWRPRAALEHSGTVTTASEERIEAEVNRLAGEVARRAAG